ncbi:catechol 2,3-dioxygenase-like lactoylglutathione lyase family enzyme [Flavobacteriaceae bacterium MAR_2010_105]|nr:catechol 2,3-dioxygenase-like lactoylglutathione lyase family enzyme [Flavobacteriaceae bacterium MAR_2010_105]
MKTSEVIGLQLSIFLISICFIGLVSCKQTPNDDALKTSVENTSFAAYNHTAFVVKDLDSSIAFYNFMFEFDTIHYPFPYREHIRAKWMSIGNGGELHLGEFKGDTTTYDYPGHIGFTVSSLDTILSRLKKINYDLPEMKYMPNGERTIHISDIDGNNIHIIERKH